MVTGAYPKDYGLLFNGTAVHQPGWLSLDRWL
jgi:hypothetical protein